MVEHLPIIDISTPDFFDCSSEISNQTQQESSPSTQIEDPQLYLDSLKSITGIDLIPSKIAELKVNTFGVSRWRIPNLTIPLTYQFPITYYCAFILLLLLPLAFGTRDYQICASSKFGHHVALPKKVTCVPPEIGKVVKAQVLVYAPNNKPNLHEAWSCHIESREICTNTGLLFSRGLVSEKLTKLAISPMLCLSVAESKTWNQRPLVQLDDTIWSSDNPTKPKYKYCCFTYCTKVENLLLVKGSVALIGTNQFMSDLSDISNCNKDAGHCENLHEVIVWDQRKLHSNCNYTYHGQYDADIIDNHILIPFLSMAVQLTSHVAPICIRGRKATVSEQGLAIEVLTLSNITKPKLSSQRSIRNSEFNIISTEIDSKLNYLSEVITNLETQNFRILWKTLCETVDRQLQIIRKFSQIQPTLAMRILLDRERIHAVWSGEVITVYDCLLVKPEKIFWSGEYNGTCYELTPVLVNKTLMFISAGSQDLTFHSMEIPCSLQSPNIYFENKTFNTVKGPIHVTSIKFELIFKGIHKIFTFKGKSIFHHALTGIFTTIASLATHSIRIFKMESQINRIIDYTSALSNQPSAVAQILRGYGAMVSTIYTSSASSISQVIHASSDSAANVVKSIGHESANYLSVFLKGTIQLFCNLAILILISVAILMVCYLIYCWILKNYNNIYIRISTFLRSKFYSHNSDPDSDNDDPPPHGELIDSELADMLASLERIDPSDGVDQVDHPTSVPKLPNSLFEHPTETVFERPDCFALGTKRCTVAARVNDTPVVALFDSGSQITVVPRRLLRTPDRYEPSKCQARSVTGHPLAIIGTAVVLIQIGNTSMRHSVTVVDNCVMDTILGVDFIKKLGKCQIDLENDELHFRKESVKLNETPAEPLWNINISANVYIPAHHECVSSCVVVGPEISSNLVIQPKQEKLFRKGLIGAHILARPIERTVPIRIMNPGSAPATLYKGSTVATAFSHKSDNLLASIKADLDEIEPIAYSKETTPLDIDPKNEIYKPLEEISIDNPDLTLTQREELLQVLKRCISVFAKDSMDLGKFNLYEMDIDTGSAAPVRQKPIPLAYVKFQRLKQHLEKLEKQGLIYRSTSPWQAPIFCVRKRDNTDRIVLNYTGLNKVLKPVIYPLPKITDLLARVGNPKFFSIVDCNSSFWQIPLNKLSQEKNWI